MRDQDHERQHIIPRPPEGGNTIDFIVTVFAIMVATVLIILTVAVVFGFIFGDNDKQTSAFFAVLTDVMTSVISALVGYIAGRGTGQAEAAKRREQERQEWPAPGGPPYKDGDPP